MQQTNMNDPRTSSQGSRFHSTPVQAIPPQSFTSKHSLDDNLSDFDEPTNGFQQDDGHSSTTTPRKMIATLFPSDDDLFIIKPFPPPQRRRPRPSHLERWIEDQRTSPLLTDKASFLEIPRENASPAIGTTANPYLAYPQMSRLSARLDRRKDVNSMSSYDFVTDDDLPGPEKAPGPLETDASEQHTSPPRPVSPTPNDRQSHKSIHTPSLRNFHLSFRSNAPSISVPDVESATHLNSPSRISLFQRSPPPSTPHVHARASSLNTHTPYAPDTMHPPESSFSGSRAKRTNWRWRPSVLGHFSYASEPQVESSDFFPRPSTSSTTSCTSATPTATTDLTDKMSCMGSWRSRAPTPFKHTVGSSNASPSPSVYSLPVHHLHSHHSHGSASTPAITNNSSTPLQVRHKQSSLRLPFTPKVKTRNDDPSAPQVIYSANDARGALPRVSFSSPTRTRRKKKLVISGIAVDDTRGFDGVKRWCESFGELHRITRMPNSDLHVHFKKAEVADTVCRLRAKVFISGVGSVHLSWYTGNRP